MILFKLIEPNLFSHFIGAILQVFFFALIPFLVYAIKFKTFKGFFDYIGFVKSTRKANILAVAASLIFAGPFLLLSFSSAEFREIMLNPESVTGEISAMGFSIRTMGILLIMALLKTSLSEEILFRGFIAKRLVSWLGFVKGNSIHAIFFGAVHAALFATITANLYFIALIFAMPTIGAYVNVYLNEKIANGSIIPGWIAHALANVMSYTIVGFYL